MGKKVLEPVHPGRVLLREFLEPLGLSHCRLARSIGVPLHRINEIVHGERAVARDMASRLSRFFGTSDRFWLNLQARFDLEMRKAGPGAAPSRSGSPPMVIAFVGLMLVGAACFGIQSAGSVPSDGEIRQILAERVAEQKRSVGIVVGVVEPGGRRIVAHGQLATDNPSEVNGDTVFEIGSITKVFTAILLADLAGEGALEIETPVQRLLGPDATVPTRNGAEITLLHLTTHSSGLPRMPNNFRPADAGNPYADYTVAQLYEFLSSHELERGIGETVEYSNLGTGLLGHVLALSQETDYESLLSERLLEPLGMSDTSITLSPSQQERLAIGHSVQLRPVANWDLPTLAGAGALRSTVNDMLTFVEANLGLRESPLQEEMVETHQSRRDFPAPGMRIGLGWVIRGGYGRDLHWHNGGTGGYRSFLGFDLEAGTGVVVLSNSGDSVDDLGFHLLDSRYRLVVPPALRTAVEVDPAVYDDYAGRYRLAEDVVFTVTRQGDRLFVQLTGQPNFEVFPESETKYFYRVVDAQITFGRDDDGAVDHLVLHQNDMDQRADRLEDETD